MRVTAHHNLKAGRRWTQIDLLQIMNHVDVDGADFSDFPMRQLLGPGTFVIVSPNSDNWCDAPQRVEHFSTANIAGMEDQINPTQRLDRLRAQQAVGIGDDTDDLLNIFRFIVQGRFSIS